MPPPSAPHHPTNKSSARSITIRIEIIILIAISLLTIFLLEFPFKPSTFLCSSSSSTPISSSSGTSKDTSSASDDTSKDSSENKQNQSPCICAANNSKTSSTTSGENSNDENNNNADDETVAPVAATPSHSKGSKKNRFWKQKEPTPTKATSSSSANQQSSSTSSSSVGSLTLLSVFEKEKEENALFSSLSTTKSLSDSRQTLLNEINSLATADDEEIKTSISAEELQTFTKLLMTLSKSVALDHRRYSSLTRKLQKVMTLSRMEYVHEVSKIVTLPSSSEDNKKKKKDANDEKSRSNKDKTSDVKKSESDDIIPTKSPTPPKRIQMFRFQSSAEDDDTLTVPSIPTDLPNLEIISPTNFGLVAGFSRKKKQQGGNDGQQQVKVATLLTGHMRSYKRCAERLKSKVLGPTDSDLFIASYQDRGEKRFGKREQSSHDDVISWNEVVNMYSPHLRGVFVGEVPLLRRRLEIAFPNAFTNKQFSWMLYQFLLIEIGLNMTEAAWRNWDFSSDTIGEMSFGSWSEEERFPFIANKLSSSTLVSEVTGKSSKRSVSAASSLQQQLSPGVWPWGHLWRNCGKDESKSGECSLIRMMASAATDDKDPSTTSSNRRPYDIFIRLRPDLFVIGTIRLSGIALPTTTLTTTAISNNEEETTAATQAAQNSQQSSVFSDLQLALECGEEAGTKRNYGNRNFVANFDDNVVLVTPHHPVYEWILDKVSDLSQVSTFIGAKKFMPMYSYLSQLSLSQQDFVFNPLCTAERLWNTRAEQLKMNQNKTFGWFAMLRNASTFRMGKTEGASSERRRQLVRKIFAITNPDEILCPQEGGVMVTFAPAVKGSKGDKKGKKRGGG